MFLLLLVSNLSQYALIQIHILFVDKNKVKKKISEQSTCCLVCQQYVF